MAKRTIGDYHRAVSETVARFDGFVAKYMGDGVLIYDPGRHRTPPGQYWYQPRFNIMIYQPVIACDRLDT